MAWTTLDSSSKGGSVPPSNPPLPKVGVYPRLSSNAWLPPLAGVGTREKRRGEGTKGIEYPLNLLLLLLTFYVGGNMGRKNVAKVG